MRWAIGGTGGKVDNMKKIINNKVYDTQTARELGSWENGDTGFGRVEETLYRKKTGEFFLHGSGGAATKYAQSVGANEWSGGEMILPLTVQAAREWAEKRLDAEAYAAVFGDPGEGDVETIIAQVPAELAARVRLLAAEKQMSLKQFVVEALEAAAQ